MNPRTTGSNRLLESKQQAVKIDRNDLGGVDGFEGLAIGEPARAEVPAALGRRPNVAIQLLRSPAAALREPGVFAIGLIARRVGVVPVAVEHRAVRHGNDPTMGGAWT